MASSLPSLLLPLSLFTRVLLGVCPCLFSAVAPHVQSSMFNVCRNASCTTTTIVTVIGSPRTPSPRLATARFTIYEFTKHDLHSSPTRRSSILSSPSSHPLSTYTHSTFAFSPALRAHLQPALSCRLSVCCGTYGILVLPIPVRST